MCDETRKTLNEAVEGLLYPSERDAPLEVVHWPGAEAKTARDLVKKIAHRRRIQPVKEEDFFAALARTDDAGRFAQLQRVFQENLIDRGIFRIGQGETSVDLFLVGRTRTGDWMGLHTTSIET